MIPAVMLTCLLPLLGGCSGMTIYSQYREASDLELIRCVGVDVEGDGVRVSISTGSDGEGSKPLVISRSAPTIPQALSALSNNPSTREPYYSHAKHVLVGEDAAKSGIAPYLDFIERSAEMRGSADLVIVRGRALDMMTEATDSEVSAEAMLSYLIENAAKTGQSCIIDASEVAAALAGRGCAMVMAVQNVQTDVDKGVEAKERVAPAGFGIISDGRLIAYAEGAAARGALLLSGRFKSAQIQAKDAQGRSVSVQLTGAKVKWTPQFDKDGGLAGFKVGLELEGNISSAEPGAEPYSDSWRKPVEENIAAIQKHCVMSALEQAKTLNADFLDIQGCLDRAKPMKMERVNNFDELLPQLESTVEVSVVLRRTFDLNSPLPVDGSYKTITGGAA